jgi:hypothetical protein
MPTSKSGLPLQISRGGYAIFADDIRAEHNGKLIIVGAYNDSIVIEATPAVLPTLSIMIVVWTPGDDPFQKCRMTAYLDDEIIMDEEFPEDRLRNHPKISADIEVPSWVAPRHELRRIVRFSPFVIEKPCALRIRVATEREEIPCGGLLIFATGSPA